MSAPRATAIVVTWRCDRFIDDCLASVFGQDLPLAVLAVDNDDDPAARARLSGRWPRLRWLVPGGNIGFAAGNNLAIREAVTEYILTVNADVTLAPDYTRRLVGFLDAHPDHGSATGLGLVPGTNPPRCDGTGHFLTRRRVTDGRKRWHDPAELTTPGARFGVCAAYALYRRSMLEDVAESGQYFDKQFFAYYEDVDLDWRARWRGWRSAFVPEAVAHHHRCGSGGLADPRILVRYYANRWLMLAKNEEVGLAVRDRAVLAEELAADLERWAHDRVLAAVLRDLLRNLPAMLAKRRALVARRQATPEEMGCWYD